MRSVPISHSITGPLARSIGPGFTGAERGKALTNAGGPSGPPFGVHYTLRSLTTPAYSSTDRPEYPGCPSFSHPTNSDRFREPTVACPMSTPAEYSLWYMLRQGKASEFVFWPDILTSDHFSGGRPRLGPWGGRVRYASGASREWLWGL